MSEKSDNAPLRIQRIDYDNAWQICYFVDGGLQRRAVNVYDDDPPAVVGAKIRALGKWIQRAANGK